MFNAVLVANRGEIACRVLRTLKRLGIRGVAVYSDADADAPHVAMADAAIRLGPAPAADSYLNIDAVLAAAQRTGAEAIHPGYGFLSENAAFAEACAAAGLIFIGPPPAAIRAMGGKAESKRLMAQAGVPLTPGYHGEESSDAALLAAAERIGYPLLVKASAGGGGKGMRAVRTAEELPAALASARREAAAAFGDDALLMERLLDRARHVEIQIFADQHGNAVHLYERDCSVQRRHQKVIEEAPAPDLTPEMRQAMGAAAVAAARAVDYVGAGTVEFLVQDGAFYFIEMNTRLQVEHPVTEMITGLDLVEWQLLAASGRVLPLTQEQIPLRGHAFEARIYAEDPARDFLPAAGKLAHLREPAAGPHVRVESGVREGGMVSPHYDPMLAKLVVWDETRDAALRRLRRALAEYELVGPATNRALLTAIAAHPAFARFDVDTRFIERFRDDLLPTSQRAAPRSAVAFAAAALLLEREQAAAAAGQRSGDPYSPWRMASGWRVNDDNHHELRFIDGETVRLATVHFRRDGWAMELDDGAMTARAVRADGRRISAEIDGARRTATVVAVGDERVVLLDGESWRLKLDDPAAKAAEQEATGGRLTAPMTGRVAQTLVCVGDVVTRGQLLMVVEAMKMEHPIQAPSDGAVTAVHAAAGEQVEDGQVLLEVEAA